MITDTLQVPFVNFLFGQVLTIKVEIIRHVTQQEEQKQSYCALANLVEGMLYKKVGINGSNKILAASGNLVLHTLYSIDCPVSWWGDDGDQHLRLVPSTQGKNNGNGTGKQELTFSGHRMIHFKKLSLYFGGCLILHNLENWALRKTQQFHWVKLPSATLARWLS